MQWRTPVQQYPLPGLLALSAKLVTTPAQLLRLSLLPNVSDLKIPPSAPESPIPCLWHDLKTKVLTLSLNPLHMDWEVMTLAKIQSTWAKAARRQQIVDDLLRETGPGKVFEPIQQLTCLNTAIRVLAC